MNITCAPIEDWPGTRTPRHQQQRSRFDSTWTATLTLLESELQKLRATQVVMQLDVTPSDIRLDGQIRANSRPRSSAVVLSFNTPKGALSFPCDRFTNWQDNVRAIAKSLEALRMVDRYGVTRGNEQYRGWSRLPPPTTAPTADMVADVLWLAKLVGVQASEITGPYNLAVAIRQAERITHPDAGGSAEDFKRVQRIKEQA
ncbi:hypothetical protein [Bremerella cremea]|uniref:hypothetical protein n=1 Tax=Bremerella cremea TaxID=1031537 RepID=UPI0031F05304